MSGMDAAGNLASKAARRLSAAHKPLLRFMRRRTRRLEHLAFARDAAGAEAAIAAVAARPGPIVAGPWLAEVGYEVLYWIPFLRWFCDAHGVPRERLIACLARRHGGALRRRGRPLRGPLRPDDAGGTGGAQRRAARQRRKAAGRSSRRPARWTSELLAAARARLGPAGGSVLPSVAVLPPVPPRLARQPADGLPVDPHSVHVRAALGPAAAAGAARRLRRRQALCGAGAVDGARVARGGSRGRGARRRRCRRWCCSRPSSASTSTATSTCAASPNVTSAAALMTPRTNLGVQLALIARCARLPRHLRRPRVAGAVSRRADGGRLRQRRGHRPASARRAPGGTRRRRGRVQPAGSAGGHAGRA